MARKSYFEGESAETTTEVAPAAAPDPLEQARAAHKAKMLSDLAASRAAVAQQMDALKAQDAALEERAKKIETGEEAIPA